MSCFEVFIDLYRIVISIVVVKSLMRRKAGDKFFFHRIPTCIYHFEQQD